MSKMCKMSKSVACSRNSKRAILCLEEWSSCKSEPNNKHLFSWNLHHTTGKRQNKYMMGGDKVIKKADQEKGEEKEISAGLDRVVREGSLEERTFEQNLQ